MEQENGRTIKIYLSDGTVSNIRHVEIMSWTGQALSCPRKYVNNLPNWSESQRPGVYFLFGIDEEHNQQAVYIGEAENVCDRIKQHLVTKDWWQEVILFTNKDENLTKAHIKYLESRLVEMAKEANRYMVFNGNTPPRSSLPRTDRADMEEFLKNLKVLIGVMGHRVLESLKVDVSKKGISNEKTDKGLFYLKIKDIVAKAQRTDEGIVVLSGSQAMKETWPSISNGNRELRENLIESGVLVQKGNCYLFTKDYLFSSPSQSAAVISGASLNGRDYWKDKSGKSIKDLEDN